MTLPHHTREKLGPVLLGAGSTFPDSHPERWRAFLRGEDPIPLSVLELDSLAFNELSISIELRAAKTLSPGTLANIETLEELCHSIFHSPIEGTTAPSGSRTRDFRSRLRGKIIRLIALNDLIAAATPEELLGLCELNPRLGFFPGLRIRLIRSLNLVLARFSGGNPLEQRLSSVHAVAREQGATWTNPRWSRKVLAKDVLLFYANQADKCTNPIVVFGGNARRPMMPMGVFLPSIPSNSGLVILVRTKQNKAFREGISGLEGGMHESFQRLAQICQDEFNRRNATGRPTLMGTSGGGIPALIFSAYLHASSIVMFGPNSTRDPRWGGHELLRLLLRNRFESKGNPSNPPVTIVFGLEGQDSEKVHAWQTDIADSVTVGIRGLGHNVLFPYAQKGKLKELFEKLLRGEVNSLD
jgi:hypothetical protein